MTASTVHGYPRIGGRRELKVATEAYWAGRTTAEELEATGRELRRDAWTFLRDAGIDEVPSNHFSFYDQMLDTIAMVGAVPYDLFVDHVAARGQERYLPHPALRRR